jgi:glyoxylase-like metal-dependent hydrolase (beta-lactamase superfamily II)
MAAIDEILPNVHVIPGAYVNMFLIASDDGLTLVDSGLKGNEKKVGKALSAINRKWSEVRHVLITHHHADHVGSLAAVKERSGATVYVHPADAPIVAGEKPRPDPNPASIAGKIAGPIIKRLPTNNPPAVAVDRELNDGDELPIAGGISVIHAPGHTLGSIAFLAPMHGGVLFAGDAAAHLMGRLGKPALIFTEDMEQAKESIRKLAALEFDTACFGHGSVVKGKANVEFRRYVEKMAK